jgi:hypothetical protein
VDEKPIPEANLRRVVVKDPYEVRRWCQRFVCTESQLREAVEKVGPEVEAVRKELKRWR